jgi:hypothetical protein
MRKLFGIAASAALVVATTATAAPVVRPADVFLGITIQNVGTVQFGGPATVTVDEVADTIQLAAGAISLQTKIIIPVTTTTAIAQLSATTLTNLAGSFFPMGGNIAGEVCPPGMNEACVNGTGVGGIMGITGTINVAIIPNIVVIPVNLNDALIGQGGTASTPFTFDAAPWTLEQGKVNTPTATVTLTGTTLAVASQFTLVTPTFVSALNNLLPIFATLTVQFTDGQGLPDFIGGVPEPGTMLLLGSGLAGLAIASRRRR